MTVVLTAGTSSNSQTLDTNSNSITLTYTITASGTKDSSCTPSDTTAPTNASINIDDGATWTKNANGTVSVDLSANDNVGVVSYKLAETQAGLGSATAVSVSPAETSFSRSNVSFTLTGSEDSSKAVWLRVTDAQGNSTDASDTIGWDKTAPTSVTTTLDDPADHNGWYNNSVGWTTNGTDATSGIASCDSGTYSGPDGTGLTVSGKCTDDAGNSSTSATSAAFDYDDTNPALSPVVSPNPVQLHGSATVTANATDGTSGVDQATVNCGSVDASSVTLTSRSVSCSAADNAGNTNSASVNYDVVYGSGFGGFLQPINTDGSSCFKLGSTIPVKFQLRDANQALVTNASAQLYLKQADSKPDPGTDEAVSTAAATTGNLFRYDATSGQYIFNFSTKNSTYTNATGQVVSLAQGTYTISVKLDDNTYRSVNIQLVR